MKYLIAFIFLLLFSTTQAQSSFESDPDVLLYLVQNSPFTNKDNEVSLTFSDMGSRLSSGRASYFSPEVVIISRTRAVVKYSSLNNYGSSVNFIVDSRENVIMDRSDRTIYKGNTWEEEDEEEETVIRKPVKKVVAPVKKTNSIKKTVPTKAPAKKPAAATKPTIKKG